MDTIFVSAGNYFVDINDFCQTKLTTVYRMDLVKTIFSFVQRRNIATGGRSVAETVAVKLFFIG